MHRPARHPDLADVRPGRRVNDFLQHLVWPIVRPEPEVPARHLRIDEHGIELITHFENSDRQIERDAPRRRGQPKGCRRIDTRSLAAPRRPVLLRIDPGFEQSRRQDRVTCILQDRRAGAARDIRSKTSEK